MLDNVPKIKTYKAFIFLHMSQCEVHLRIVAGVFPWSLACAAEKIASVPTWSLDALQLLIKNRLNKIKNTLKLVYGVSKV